MFESLNGHVHFLDLDENICRKIFSHLDHCNLYFSLKNVCRTLKNYVDSYIQFGGAFILSPRTPDTPIELLYIFKRNNKPVSSCSKLIPPLPYPSDSHAYNTLTRNEPINYLKTFGGIIKGNVIVGVYYRKGKKCKYFFCRFMPKSCKWLPIFPLEKQNGIESQSDQNQSSERFPMASCATEDSILVLENIEHINLNRNRRYISNVIRRFCFNVPRAWNDTLETQNKDSSETEDVAEPCPSQSTYYYSLCSADLGHEYESRIDTGLVGCSMSQLDNENFVVFGLENGWQGWRTVSESDFTPRMYKITDGGIFEKRGDDLTKSWPKLSKEDQSIYEKYNTDSTRNWKIHVRKYEGNYSIKKCKRPIFFKLKTSLYIGGGYRATSIADRKIMDLDDINDGSYKGSFSHVLPYHVDSSDNNAITDEHETFAVISREYQAKTLVFTQEDGFYELPNHNYEETWRNYHLPDREKELLPKSPLLRIK